jgi:hypothetical protein
MKLEEDMKEEESSFLLWQGHDRPKALFNLIPFAITYNSRQPRRLTQDLE